MQPEFDKALGLEWGGSDLPIVQFGHTLVNTNSPSMLEKKCLPVNHLQGLMCQMQLLDIVYLYIYCPRMYWHFVNVDVRRRALCMRKCSQCDLANRKKETAQSTIILFLIKFSFALQQRKPSLKVDFLKLLFISSAFKTNGTANGRDIWSVFLSLRWSFNRTYVGCSQISSRHFGECH